MSLEEEIYIKVQWKCIVKCLYFGHFFSLFYPEQLYTYIWALPPLIWTKSKRTAAFRDVFPYLGGRYVELSTQYD